MQFETFADFLNMGGYAFYVWLSFGLSGTLLLILLATSKSSHKKIKTDIIQQIKREEKLKKAAQLHANSQEVTDES